MVLFNKLLLCMQLLHHGMIWDTRAGIKLREQCCGWAETCNEFAERGVKQNWEGRNGLGKGSFCGLGVHLSDCIYLWWGEMSDRHNREGKHSACLVSPSLCSRSHALIIIRNTRSTPQVTTSHPFSSTPTETLSPAWHPVSTCQPSFLRAACPRALLPGLPMPQLTIARTIRIFRGIMTGLVKHSCPRKSLIFLLPFSPSPGGQGVTGSILSSTAHRALLMCPVTPQPQCPAHTAGEGVQLLCHPCGLLLNAVLSFSVIPDGSSVTRKNATKRSWHSLLQAALEHPSHRGKRQDHLVLRVLIVPAPRWAVVLRPGEVETPELTGPTHPTLGHNLQSQGHLELSRALTAPRSQSRRAHTHQQTPLIY